MIARVLPQDEWWRVDADALEAMFLYAKPEDLRVVVVESGGNIVARMFVVQFTHLEGAWIDPAHRNAGVTNALIEKMFEASRDFATKHVIAGAAESGMVKTLARLGAVHLPLQFYSIGV